MPSELDHCRKGRVQGHKMLSGDSGQCGPPASNLTPDCQAWWQSGGRGWKISEFKGRRVQVSKVYTEKDYLKKININLKISPLPLEG